MPAWVVLVALGGAALLRYENSPGTDAGAPARWPEGSSIERDPSRPTLLLFAHPRCPCTRATLGELAKIAAIRQGRASMKAVFFRPQGSDPDWARTGLWRSAAAIPGVEPLDDEGGAQARLFGAETSGRVALYSADGGLLWAGGITASRGHHGDNAGADSVAALLAGGEASGPSVPAFGCPIHDLEPCRQEAETP